MEEIDILLQREILPGKEFDKVIPKFSCKTVGNSRGNTDHSIEKMGECVRLYSWQMEGVATLLSRSSLEDSVFATFEFCFDHFQYKSDKELQELRSPACSWFDRYNGIDCKSYSIIASAIFTEMGIKHYFRKIRQKAPAHEWATNPKRAAHYEQNFSHVYVIIPLDQKTGLLDDGYYVCDGTVFDNQEPAFIESKDEFMELPHVMLNAPQPKSFYGGLGDPTTPTSNNGSGSNTGSGTTTTTNSGTSSGTAIWNAAVQSGSQYATQNSGSWFKKISFKSIGNLLKTPIGCWGGTAFSDAVATADLDSVTTYLTKILNEMNDALQGGNMTLFSDKVNQYYGMTAVLTYAVGLKAGEKNWNQCSNHNFQAMGEGMLFYYNGTMDKSLDAYLAQFFVSTKSGYRDYNIYQSLNQGVMPFCSYTTPMATAHIAYEVFTLKPGVAAAPAFVPTPYVTNLIQNPSAFNADDFLKSLADFYGVVMNPGSIFTGNQGGSGTNQNGGGSSQNGGGMATIDQPPKTQTASLKYLGYAAAAGGLWWLGMELFGKDKPQKKTLKTAA